MMVSKQIKNRVNSYQDLIVFAVGDLGRDYRQIRRAKIQFPRAIFSVIKQIKYKYRNTGGVQVHSCSNYGPGITSGLNLLLVLALFASF